jgi:hypothetical protein
MRADDNLPTLEESGPLFAETYAPVEEFERLAENDLSEDRVTWAKRNLSPRQQQVCRLRAAGGTPEGIAAVMNYAPATVSGICNGEAGRIFISWLMGRLDDDTVAVQSLIRSQAIGATMHVVNVMKDATVSTEHRLRAAFSLLDRAGHKAAENVNVNATHSLDITAIERIRKADAVTADIERHFAAGDLNAPGT